MTVALLEKYTKIDHASIIIKNENKIVSTTLRSFIRCFFVKHAG